MSDFSINPSPVRRRIPLLTDINQSIRPAYRAGGKRVLDAVAGSLLLIAFLPLIAILALLAARDGGNPIFSQKRVGQNGRLFDCYKIRSMVVDAQERLEELLRTDPAAAAEWARDQKLENDPRITAFGHFIRRTSLDELPQLWNVVRGDMSLVGPRPVVPDELARYGDKAPVYRSMVPGLTGPWQVSGRNSISYEERVWMDVDYARRLSLFGDLRILWLTGLTVLKRTGR